MSFSVYVKCNCEKKGNMKYPPFKDKLEFSFGLYELKKEYCKDEMLQTKLCNWKFCDHNQIAVEFDLSGIRGFRKLIDTKYFGQFDNFKAFIPEYNQWVNSNYNKNKALRELQLFNELEGNKWEHRVIQFTKLLETAIEMDEEIYWM